MDQCGGPSQEGTTPGAKSPVWIPCFRSITLIRSSTAPLDLPHVTKSLISQPKAIREVTKGGSLHTGGLRHLQRGLQFQRWGTLA